MRLDGADGKLRGIRYLYHDPCHSPIKTDRPMKVVNELMGSGVTLSERCCGESGTLSVTRPDIATQVRFHKEEELRRSMTAIGDQGHRGQTKILTSCPSCLQGLARFREDTGAQADYVVVEMARHLLGADWLTRYVDKANRGGIERVLL